MKQAISQCVVAAAWCAAAWFQPAVALPYDPNQPAPVGADTIILFDFNESAGSTANDTADPVLDGANDGAISGSNHSWDSGKFGGALKFLPTASVNSWVSAAVTAGVYNANNQATMAAWINPAATQAPDGTYVMGVAGNNAASFIRFNGGGGALAVGFKAFIPSLGEYRFIEASHGAYADFAGKWTHVAATFDNGVVQIWVNGAEVARNNTYAGDATLPAATSLIVGGVPWAPGVPGAAYAGLIDDVRLLNAHQAALVPADVVVEWNLNETTGTNAPDTAALGGFNNGAVSGTANWVEGYPGNALDFDGTTNDVQTAVTGSLFVNQQVTMSAWIKPATAQSDAYILGLSGANNAFLRFNITSSGGQLNAGFHTSAGWVEAVGGNPSSWYVGAWTHVAATFDNGTTSLYVNGELIGSGSVAGAVFGAPTTFIAGNAPWGGSSRYSGAIDEVRLMNYPQSPTTPATIVQWDLDETGGTVAPDAAEFYGVNDGAISGSNHSWDSGKFGGALKFLPTASTNSWVSTEVTPGVYNANNQATMAAWINPAATQAPEGSYVMGVAGNNAEAFIRFNDGGGALAVGFKAFIPSLQVYKYIDVSHGAYADFVGKWTKVEATFYDGLVTLWVNGAEVAGNSTYVGDATLSEATSLIVGGVPWAPNYPRAAYAGLIDDVRLLNSAPAPADVPTDVPMLDISVAGGVASVSWPASTDPAWQLQSSPDLSAGSWVDVTTPPTVVGGDFVVDFPITGLRQFYRLKK